jgi:hypothetical protein
MSSSLTVHAAAGSTTEKSTSAPGTNLRAPPREWLEQPPVEKQGDQPSHEHRACHLDDDVVDHKLGHEGGKSARRHHVTDGEVRDVGHEYCIVAASVAIARMAAVTIPKPIACVKSSIS